MTPRFDPTRAIVYDLARGQLRDDEGTARLNIPAALLVRLCESAGTDAARDFAQSLGSELGRRIATRLGQDADSASVETWTEHLGGQLALLGMGDLAVEQWGRALVITVTGAPQDADSMIADILGTALQRSLGAQCRLISFSRDGGSAFLVVSSSAAERVEKLKAEGAALGQVVEALHQGAA